MLINELLQKGGSVMAVILLLSVYVVAVILYKFFQLGHIYFANRNLFKQLGSSLQMRQYNKACEILAKYNTPLSKLANLAIKLKQDRDLSEEQRLRQIEVLGAKEIRAIETHLRGLEMSAAIAPLLGLLGTVVGMVKSFAGIGDGGTNVDPSVLAVGIWQALLATVAGLCVAIPALAAYYIIDGRIENIRAIMKDIVSEIIYS